MEIARALTDIVGDKHFASSSSALAAVGLVDQPERSAWLVTPGSAAEIAELVQLAARHRIAVIPVGAGARPLNTASLGDRRRFFVHIKRLNHVLHLDETSLTVHVQAGLTALALEKILAPRGLSMGEYPPQALGSTLGGLLAVRTPGKSSRKHGFIEEAVLGVSAVLADGRMVHTRVAPRRATGPDLARALCGSEGTIGIITSVVLRIHRKAETRYLSAFALPDVDAALTAVRIALREEAAPSALCVYDEPEARVRLDGSFVTAGEAMLVAAVTGPTDLAACDRDLLHSAVAAAGGRQLDEEVAVRWWRLRTGKDQRSAELPLPTLQVSATPKQQPVIYHAVVEAARGEGFDARARVVRFDHDGAVFFFTATVAGGDRALVGDQAAAVREPLERAARAAGAFLLDTHNPELEPYYEALRRKLDPHDIMNPGALRR
jgi:alkyldihydroxyacetonephosphate synthase